MHWASLALYGMYDRVISNNKIRASVYHNGSVISQEKTLYADLSDPIILVYVLPVSRSQDEVLLAVQQNPLEPLFQSSALTQTSSWGHWVSFTKNAYAQICARNLRTNPFTNKSLFRKTFILKLILNIRENIGTVKSKRTQKSPVPFFPSVFLSFSLPLPLS